MSCTLRSYQLSPLSEESRQWMNTSTDFASLLIHVIGRRVSNCEELVHYVKGSLANVMKFRLQVEMASSLAQLQIPKLTKDLRVMKMLFGSQDLWEIVTDGYVEPTTEQEAAYTADQRTVLKDEGKKDKKALFLLYQGVGDATFEKITEATSSKKA